VYRLRICSAETRHGRFSPLLFSRPDVAGGKPEAGRAHFERAIALSDGRNLIAKVELARRYARMMFDRRLHDTLLQDVMQAEIEAPGLTLSNALASTGS